MPDPNSVSSGYNSGHIDLSQAPGADADWDSLFPNSEVVTALSPQATPGTNPQQPSADQVFLKAGDTVYKTAEDAIEGTAHKDNLIATYRKFLTDNGVDPNSMQRTAQATQPQPDPGKSNSQYKLYGNPEFFDKVAGAARDGNRVEYEKLMSQHTQEAIQAQLDPWRATLAETNRFRAIRQATVETPDFGRFIDGPGYKKVLDSFPLYKEMVQIGENDPVAAQRLPEVYRSMYLIHQGMNQTQTQSQTSNVTPNTPTVRQQPTLQPSALTPPAPNSSTQGWQEARWRGNKPIENDARKQLIQDGNDRFKGMKFEDLGL